MPELDDKLDVTMFVAQIIVMISIQLSPYVLTVSYCPNRPVVS
jgi:hypothetical protein